MFSVTLDIAFTDNCCSVALYFQGLQARASVQYTFRNVMISGKKLQEKCEETKEDGARINDTTSLQNALRNITPGNEYWTGLR